jgi:hypothetical protein
MPTAPITTTPQPERVQVTAGKLSDLTWCPVRSLIVPSAVQELRRFASAPHLQSRCYALLNPVGHGRPARIGRWQEANCGHAAPVQRLDPQTPATES